MTNKKFFQKLKEEITLTLHILLGNYIERTTFSTKFLKGLALFWYQDQIKTSQENSRPVSYKQRGGFFFHITNSFYRCTSHLIIKFLLKNVNKNKNDKKKLGIDGSNSMGEKYILLLNEKKSTSNSMHHTAVIIDYGSERELLEMPTRGTCLQ